MGQVAIYCRVSTDDQSCSRQERDLRAFTKRAGHEIVAVLKETASGAKNDRPERNKVMALAQVVQRHQHTPFYTIPTAAKVMVPRGGGP